MPSIPAWILPVWLFGVWFLWVLASAIQVRVREIKSGTQPQPRGGVSILPGIPLFPLLFLGAAFLTDSWFAPWGSIVIAGFHLLFAIALVFTIIRDGLYCRKHSND
ncbi:MAG: hypothetical protein IPK22_07855 [Verrucomicrobiaceae bacterium]|nr:hypothetical protein [Verrucomicrobiaceae bacterium]